ncbi:MAG: helix-turn-helix transcriptional regulator [Clostridium sp.]
MKNKMKMYRASKNISQDDLAKELGMSRAYVSNLERGKSIPRLDMMIKISEILESKVESIFCLTEDS